MYWRRKVYMACFDTHDTRYWRRKVYMACFQFRPLTVAARMAFSIVFMKRSASPLALGQYGVILRCLNPRRVAKFLNSSLLNGGHALSREYGIKLRNCGFRRCGGENFDFWVLTVFVNHDYQILACGKRSDKINCDIGPSSLWGVGCRVLEVGTFLGSRLDRANKS